MAARMRPSSLINADVGCAFGRRYMCTHFVISERNFLVELVEIIVAVIKCATQ